MIDNPYKSTILMLALVSSMFDILRYLLQNILQTTGRIKDFARIMTLERMLFFVLSVGALLLGFRNFYVLIFMEITGVDSVHVLRDVCVQGRSSLQN